MEVVNENCIADLKLKTHSSTPQNNDNDSIKLNGDLNGDEEMDVESPCNGDNNGESMDVSQNGDVEDSADNGLDEEQPPEESRTEGESENDRLEADENLEEEMEEDQQNLSVEPPETDEQSENPADDDEVPCEPESDQHDDNEVPCEPESDQHDDNEVPCEPESDQHDGDEADGHDEIEDGQDDQEDEDEGEKIDQDKEDELLGGDVDEEEGPEPTMTLQRIPQDSESQDKDDGNEDDEEDKGEDESTIDLVTPVKNTDEEDDEDARNESTPEKTPGGSKKKKPTPITHVTPRRSSRNLNKSKSYNEDAGDKFEDLEEEVQQQSSTPKIPIKLLPSSSVEIKPAVVIQPATTIKKNTIVVNDTKRLAEIAAGSKANAAKGGKKEPTLVIIDTNSLLANKSGAVSLTPTISSRVSVMPVSSSQNLMRSGGVKLPSAVSITPPPSLAQKVTGLTITKPVKLPGNVTITPPQQPKPPQPQVILPSLTDDMFVVEAPSFIVPYVYEKPPVNDLKEFNKVLGEKVKEEQNEKRKKEEEDDKKREDEEKKRKEIQEEVKEQNEEDKEKDKEEDKMEVDDENKDKENEKEKDEEKKDEDMEVEEKKEEVKEESEKIEVDKDKIDDDKAKAEDKDGDKAKVDENDDNKAKTDDKDIDKAKTDDKEIDKAKTDDKEVDKAKTEDTAKTGDKDADKAKTEDKVKAEEKKDAVTPAPETKKLEGEVLEDKTNKTKSDNYFENPLGKFFMQIGINLVQEHVQADLLKNQLKKKEKEGSKCSADVHMAISALTKTLEVSKENNKPFAFDMKKCQLCNFKTESNLAMAHHLETPHMKNFIYRCNFCELEVRSPHDILFHMEAEHNVRGRLDRSPAFHQCPNCPFEDNQKGKLSRHLLSCAKKYKPERNQEPPLEWEPPAKIPRVRGARGLPLYPNAAAGSLAAAARLAQPVAGVNNSLSRLAASQQAALAAQRGRGRPPIYVQRYPTSSPQSAQKLAQHIRQGGVVFRPSNQPPVLLPTAPYSLTPSLLQQASKVANGATNKILQQPSISITPLPRAGAQANQAANAAANASAAQAAKPGRPQASSTPAKNSFVICEICDGYIKDLEQLRNHMQWIHKVKIHPKMIYNRPPLNCQKCQFRFFTDQGLERHLLGSHGLVTSSMQEAANKGKDGGRCPVCGRVYQWKLLNHVARDHSMSLKPAHLSYKCTVCTATFGMYKQFENHVYSAHSVVAKRVIDKTKPGGASPSATPSAPSTSNSNESMLKPLKINDEITIIPQPARAKQAGAIKTTAGGATVTPAKPSSK